MRKVTGSIKVGIREARKNDKNATGTLVPFTKRVWEKGDVERVDADSKVRIGSIVLAAESLGGLMIDEFLDLLNYAEDLKQRAKAKSGSEPGKKYFRELAEKVVFLLYRAEDATAEDKSLLTDMMEASVTGGQDGKNAWLDELVQTDEFEDMQARAGL